MAYRSFSYRKIIKFNKIKASTKVWKVQIKLPCGYCLDENNKRMMKTTKWTIWQILN